jgi:ribose-phosphate pyrophosphokinase
MLVYFEDESALALRLAQASGLRCAAIERHCFPDGEIRLRLPLPLPERVVILRGLQHGGDKLTELLLAAPTARSLGARHLALVCPYLAYMRQDMAFRPGEAVSQRIVGRLLADLFDTVITVDPHLHRVASLHEAVPAAHALALSGAPLLGDWIATQLHQPLLMGPDAESAAWVTQAAAAHGFDHAVCEKVRHGDRQVEIALPHRPLKGRAVVLIDDVASSGRTLAQATRLLVQAGAASVDVAVTHALFMDDALAVIHAAGVRHVWSTDCIAHPSNVVSMVPALASALLQAA